MCLLKVEGKKEAVSTIEKDFTKDSEILEQRQDRTQKIDFPITIIFFRECM